MERIWVKVRGKWVMPAVVAVYGVGLAIATLIEKYAGTGMAMKVVYHAPWFIALQAMGAVYLIYKVGKMKRLGAKLVHVGIVVIVVGAMVTHLWGKEGSMHLREGDISDRMVVHTPKGEAYHVLPFEVELKDFILTRYAGSMSPSSFESRLVVHEGGGLREARVWMNHVMEERGYRFYQASYDRDERGTILMVVRDVWGSRVTYMGYALLIMGLLWGLVERGGAFQGMRRRLKGLRGVAMMVLGMMVGVGMPEAKGSTPEARGEMVEVVARHVVEVGHGAKFGELAVRGMNGRLMPAGVLCGEVVRKVHKGERVGGMSAEQVVLGMMAMPEMWAGVKMIAVPGKGYLGGMYGLSEPYCAYVELFDEGGGYKLAGAMEAAYGRAPVARTRYDKDIIQLDERVQTVMMVMEGRMVRLFPHSGEDAGRWYGWGEELEGWEEGDSMFVAGIGRWYMEAVREGIRSGDWGEAEKVLGMIGMYQGARSEELAGMRGRLKAEVVYNKVNPFGVVKKGYLILGLVLMVVGVWGRLRGAGVWKRRIRGIVEWGVVGIWVVHLVGMGVRGYISGAAPWSNGYETMVMGAACVMGAGLWLRKVGGIVFGMATVFAGVILFVSGLSWMDPQISPLVPVLKSPWLMTHVSVMMMAYGFFGMAAVGSLGWMCMRGVGYAKRREELTILVQMGVLIGEALMVVGTILGAVWANVSWGRYWGWDPKETWALITIVVYGVLLHWGVRGVRDARVYHIAVVVAVVAVWMTWFGVGMWLSGMHSYK
jgi:ABC-type transport system involved in cytochrome c biogenesis permease subunit